MKEEKRKIYPIDEDEGDDDDNLMDDGYYR
jgi:hypothetical protein